MDFDMTAERETCGCKIEYGIFRGGEKIVFVKAGRGGTFRGYGDKYLRFAEYLRSEYGASVICADNPEDCRNSAEADVSVLCTYAEEAGFAAPRFYFWGTSDGGFKGVDMAECLKLEKAVLVNMPLMVNFYRTKERMKKLGGKLFAFVYGDADPSYKYVPFLHNLEGCKIVILENTSHRLECNEKERELFGRLIFT
ncbi:MAG: hypothetical protein IJW21_01655 [Clostridia bacterium]|nr:hypothetical protein [Clostridia bacterium]